MVFARLVCLVLALSAASVRAAPAESALSGPFDIETAVAVALERSPGLQAAAHRIRAAEHLADAEGRPEPTRLTFDIWQVPLARPWAWNESPMVMLGLRQPVPAAGSLKARAAARRKDAAADAANRDVVAQDLATAVRHAFIDYAAATARHSVHLEHQRVSEHVLGLAKARQVVGGTLLEIARAETEVARARADVATDATATQAARTRLNTLMARDAHAPLGAPKDPAPATITADARGLITDAQGGRPETRAADARREAAALDLRAARREANLPSAMLGVAYFPATRPMPMHGYGLMIDLQLPWLSGQGRKRRDAQAELSAAAVRDVAQVKLSIAGEVSGALATVQSAAERYQALTREARPASVRAREVALTGYEAGRGDFTELLAAEGVHVEVAMDVIAAKSDLDHALIDLDRAVGSPVARRPLAQGPAAP
ncbi:TolC family protein [Nannocystis radixulma]|uniref:TolC family protein n=1 Tax=Nannocystis radixulma TaxID=2995305 RepID=A0ABT5B979_9BACT|nr:TolC family protein [Nannocystis radixulma]MCY1055579.1 TolC family protein [Nannocystis sp. SCPEA4]MDC0670682.1 TolC family protein [Nannocystis radixulma]